MVAATVSGESILGALEARLEYLLACEKFLFDLYNHPDQPLKTIPEKVKSLNDLSQWDRDKLTEVIRWVEQYRVELEMQEAKHLRPVEAFVAELPHLKKAASLVSSISYIIRHRLTDQTRVESNKVVYRSLRDRLDTLTEFDDSE